MNDGVDWGALRAGNETEDERLKTALLEGYPEEEHEDWSDMSEGERIVTLLGDLARHAKLMEWVLLDIRALLNRHD